MTSLRFGWVGFHQEGLLAFRGVLERGIRIEALLTLPPERAARRSGPGDHAAVAAEFGVPVHYVKNINDPDALRVLQDCSLDVVFVIGWTQILSAAALRTARIGMIGAHASLLPDNRGRAPVNWALIHGLSQTGNSLMWLAEDVDGGDLIDQVPIPVTAYDTCESIYGRVAEANRDMILRVIAALYAGERPGRRQPASTAPLLPGRRPEDGAIDWSHPSARVYDFIRALTRPYPGAFAALDGQRWKIWRAALLPGEGYGQSAAGQVLGPVVSPTEDSCGVAVACGRGAVVLLEIESDDAVLKGRALSEQRWEGRIWS
jgi:methionyl-tRNA formyltransferase